MLRGDCHVPVGDGAFARGEPSSIWSFYVFLPQQRAGFTWKKSVDHFTPLQHEGHPT